MKRVLLLWRGESLTIDHSLISLILHFFMSLFSLWSYPDLGWIGGVNIWLDITELRNGDTRIWSIEKVGHGKNLLGSII